MLTSAPSLAIRVATDLPIPELILVSVYRPGKLDDLLSPSDESFFALQPVVANVIDKGGFGFQFGSFAGGSHMALKSEGRHGQLKKRPPGLIIHPGFAWLCGDGDGLKVPFSPIGEVIL